MKTKGLLFILAFAASALQAQDEDLYSMVHQDMGGYGALCYASGLAGQENEKGFLFLQHV